MNAEMLDAFVSGGQIDVLNFFAVSLRFLQIIRSSDIELITKRRVLSFVFFEN